MYKLTQDGAVQEKSVDDFQSIDYMQESLIDLQNMRENNMTMVKVVFRKLDECDQPADRRAMASKHSVSPASIVMLKPVQRREKTK